MGIAEPGSGSNYYCTVPRQQRQGRPRHANQPVPATGREGQTQGNVINMEESQEDGLAVASRQRQKAKQSNVSRVQYPNLTLGGNKSD